MSEIPFLEHCVRVEEFVLSKYGIAVVTRDIPDPLTGDLDGLEIHTDYALTAEERLFLLAHLFGHTVQWNVNPAAFEIGRQYRPPVEEDLFLLQQFLPTSKKQRGTVSLCFMKQILRTWTIGSLSIARATKLTCCITIGLQKRAGSMISGEKQFPSLNRNRFLPSNRPGESFVWTEL